MSHTKKIKTFILICFMFMGVVEAQCTDESAVITPPAFSILSVEHNLTTQPIDVKLHVGGGSKHFPLLCMSKPGWSEAYPEQIDASENPCQPRSDGTVRVEKTCCLHDFVDQYRTASDVENRFRTITGVFNNGQNVVPSFKFSTSV